MLRLGDTYRMYYWGGNGPDSYVILMAETSVDEPNAWRPRGGVLLGPQPESEVNCRGPSFPFVLPRDDGPWLMTYCGWGAARADGTLANTCGLALSHDAGLTWEYLPEDEQWPLTPPRGEPKPYDVSATGSVSVVRASDSEYRMYYTALGEYFPRPDGAESGHGDTLPRIGVALAVADSSGDARLASWHKPLDALLVEPRGFNTEPYEYIASKPFVIRDGEIWRMWLGTFGTAYRIRSLTSLDGISWARVPSSGSEGELGVGRPGDFDSEQRCYASVVKHGDGYRMWFTGNGFGSTGMGYAEGTVTAAQAAM